MATMTYFQICSEWALLALVVAMGGCSDGDATSGTGGAGAGPPSCTLDPSDRSFQQIESYNGAILLRRANGEVDCWGRDFGGSCGGYVPYPVKTLLSCVRKLESNGGQSALLYEDNVAVWGGPAQFVNAEVDPSLGLNLAELSPPLLGVRASAATGNALAVVDADGALWVWGLAPDGVRYEQLTKYAFPAKIEDLQSTAGLCGRLENGEVYCVGFDPEGSFGLPEAPNDTVLTPTKLEIPLAVGFAYGFAASCALDADGVLRCSGHNHGILGLDPTQVPSRRSFDVVPGLPRVDRIKVSDAGDRACASVGGDLYCWGANDWGCIQPDGPDDVYTPTLMEPFHDIVDFTPSEAICVIRANGSVWCHGDQEQNGACGMPGDGQWAEVKFEGCDAF